MRSATILYSAVTTFWSVMRGIRLALWHSSLPDSPLHRLNLTVLISTFVCSAVSLGLSYIKKANIGVGILRGVIAVLITLPGVVCNPTMSSEIADCALVSRYQGSHGRLGRHVSSTENMFSTFRLFLLLGKDVCCHMWSLPVSANVVCGDLPSFTRLFSHGVFLLVATWADHAWIPDSTSRNIFCMPTVRAIYNSLNYRHRGLCYETLVAIARGKSLLLLKWRRTLIRKAPNTHYRALFNYLASLWMVRVGNSLMGLDMPNFAHVMVLMALSSSYSPLNARVRKLESPAAGLFRSRSRRSGGTLINDCSSG